MNNFVYQFGNSLYINLTNRCSNDCVFCIRNYSNGIGDSDLWLTRELEVHEVIEQIENFRNQPANSQSPDINCQDEVIFCGFGEPTYRLEQLIKIAKYLKSIGKTTRLNTNGLGSLINNRDITKELAKVIDIISISLNAPNAEKYNELCKSIFKDLSHAEIINFAKKCVEQGIQTTLSIMNNLTQKETKECQNLAQKIGAELRIRHMA